MHSVGVQHCVLFLIVNSTVHSCPCKCFVQTELSVCQVVCVSVWGVSQEKLNITMETKAGIMKRFERFVKMMGMVHAFGTKYLTLLKCVCHQR